MKVSFVKSERNHSLLRPKLVPVIFLAFIGALLLVGVAYAAIVSHKLSGPMQEMGEVSYYEISPDASQVIYIADAIFPGRDELFSVPTRGRIPVPLTPDLVYGGMVKEAHISPDSQREFYFQVS